MANIAEKDIVNSQQKMYDKQNVYYELPDGQVMIKSNSKNLFLLHISGIIFISVATICFFLFTTLFGNFFVKYTNEKDLCYYEAHIVNSLLKFLFEVRTSSEALKSFSDKPEVCMKMIIQPFYSLKTVISEFKNLVSSYCPLTTINQESQNLCLNSLLKRDISYQFHIWQHISSLCKDDTKQIIEGLSNLNIDLDTCETFTLPLVSNFEPLLKEHLMCIKSIYPNHSNNAIKYLFSISWLSFTLVILSFSICTFYVMAIIFLKRLIKWFKNLQLLIKRSEESKQSSIHDLGHLLLSIFNNRTQPRNLAVTGIASLLLSSHKISESQRKIIKIFERASIDLLNTQNFCIEYIISEAQLGISKNSYLPINIRYTLERCLRRYRSRAMEKKTQLSLLFASGCPTLIISDKERLLKIFSNVISSAIDRVTAPNQSINIYVSGQVCQSQINSEVRLKEYSTDFSNFDVNFQIHDQGNQIGEVTDSMSVVDSLLARRGENISVFEAQANCENLNSKLKILPKPTSGNILSFTLRSIARFSISDFDHGLQNYTLQSAQILTFGLTFESSRFLTQLCKELNIKIVHCPCLNNLKKNYSLVAASTVAIFLGDFVAVEIDSMLSSPTNIFDSLKYQDLEFSKIENFENDVVEVFVVSLAAERYNSNIVSKRDNSKTNNFNHSEKDLTQRQELNNSEHNIKTIRKNRITLLEPLAINEVVRVILRGLKLKGLPPSKNMTSQQDNLDIELFKSPKISQFHSMKTLSKLKPLRKDFIFNDFDDFYEQTKGIEQISSPSSYSSETSNIDDGLLIDENSIYNNGNKPRGLQKFSDDFQSLIKDSDLQIFFPLFSYIPDILMTPLILILSCLESVYLDMKIKNFDMICLEMYFNNRSAFTKFKDAIKPNNYDMNIYNYQMTVIPPHHLVKANNIQLNTVLNKNQSSKLPLISPTTDKKNFSLGLNFQQLEVIKPDDVHFEELFKEFVKRDQPSPTQSEDIFSVKHLMEDPGSIKGWISWEFDILEEKRSNLILKARDLLYFCANNAGIRISPYKLLKLVYYISENYKNTNPFHNFYHAVSVSQIVFLLQSSSKLKSIYTFRDYFLMSLAALSHDVRHPGVNNKFLASIQSFVSQVYNETSVLENYHASTLFQIIRISSDFEPIAKILKVLPTRKRIVSAIISTDIEQHFIIAKKLKIMISECMGKEITEIPLKFNFFNFLKRTDKFFLESCLLHGADIANPLLQFNQCKKWALRIAVELHNQIELEHHFNLPFTMPQLIDMNTQTVAKFQLDFIDSFCGPFFEILEPYLSNDIMERIKIKDENRVKWLILSGGHKANVYK